MVFEAIGEMGVYNEHLVAGFIRTCREFGLTNEPA